MNGSCVVLGYYGFGNLGDELLLRACVKILNSRGIDNDKIIALSNSPDETRKAFNIRAVNRWKIFEVAKALRSCDALILGGGGLFQDSTSVKSCAYYWGVVRLARFFGLKVFALGQSIGPLKSRLAKFFAGDALRACERVHVRDQNSFNLAKSFGCQDTELGFDIVMTLAAFEAAPPPARPLMLVNVRSCENLEAFVNVIAPHVRDFDGDKIGAALSAEDEKILLDLKEALNLKEIKLVKTFDDASELWALASCGVGMRLHFGVLSRIFRTPVALMPYDVKVSQFAEQSAIPLITHEWREPSMPSPAPVYDTIST